jgi:hypothetical protein
MPGFDPLSAMRACCPENQTKQGMMKMKMRSLPNLLASLLFLGASNLVLAADEPAEVATLNKVEGTVMVDHGKGFVSFKAPAKLNEGDRVITLSDSAAEIVFSDGCKAELKANSMIAIALSPGCKAAIISVNGASVASAGAAAGTIAAQSFAGVPVLAAGGAYLLFDSGKDNTPISGE